jgi:hypothetical protein
LTGETLERFESVYLASPRRRQKVEFASSFLRAVDRTTVPADQEPAGEPGPQPVGEQDGAPQPALDIWRAIQRSSAAWLPAVAAALLVCASGALLIRNVQVGRELNESRRERATLSQRVSELEQQLKSQQTAYVDVANALERVRTSQSPGQEKSSDLKPSGRGTSASLSTIAMTLLPMTRSADAVPTLTIPAGTDRVAFELRLEANEFPRYRVALRDPATGSIVWRSGEVASPSTSSPSRISVLVPAGILKAQHYSLELLGQRAAGREEEVAASYAFKAVR